ncbi:hypothetical protein LX64_02183 [Chitinophaga skermanii]|uniref:Uncharacterized protein n=1 Tax=Chitinophaga skermanii TaxID=331697 RepID=A0A327QKH6_9BACT|nr:hypothetical protein [Chitinophaga skermanii]RAJ05029.1 hypothetical protein LX64_02183 [Chitinophaga skermanii]
MKLPTFTSSTTVRNSGQFYASRSFQSAQQVQPAGIFDIIKDIGSAVIGKAPCVLAAAGPKGVSCLASCGPNPACLATCAGPALVQSIMGCL